MFMKDVVPLREMKHIVTIVKLKFSKIFMQILFKFVKYPKFNYKARVIGEMSNKVKKLTEDIVEYIAKITYNTVMISRIIIYFKEDK